MRLPPPQREAARSAVTCRLGPCSGLLGLWRYKILAKYYGSHNILIYQVILVMAARAALLLILHNATDGAAFIIYNVISMGYPSLQ
jgi:hypothetical protein